MLRNKELVAPIPLGGGLASGARPLRSWDTFHNCPLSVFSVKVVRHKNGEFLARAVEKPKKPVRLASVGPARFRGLPLTAPGSTSVKGTLRKPPVPSWKNML